MQFPPSILRISAYFSLHIFSLSGVSRAYSIPLRKRATPTGGGLPLFGMETGSGADARLMGRFCTADGH